jgi:hypothetical protein
MTTESRSIDHSGGIPGRAMSVLVRLHRQVRAFDQPTQPATFLKDPGAGAIRNDDPSLHCATHGARPSIDKPIMPALGPYALRGINPRLRKLAATGQVRLRGLEEGPAHRPRQDHERRLIWVKAVSADRRGLRVRKQGNPQ